jgi:hypothetical protein
MQVSGNVIPETGQHTFLDGSSGALRVGGLDEFRDELIKDTSLSDLPVEGVKTLDLVGVDNFPDV